MAKKVTKKLSKAAKPAARKATPTASITAATKASTKKPQTLKPAKAATTSPRASTKAPAKPSSKPTSKPTTKPTTKSTAKPAIKSAKKSAAKPVKSAKPPAAKAPAKAPVRATAKATATSTKAATVSKAVGKPAPAVPLAPNTAPKSARTPSVKVAKEAPAAAKPPASAAVEAKPSTKLPAKPAAIDLPLYPIAPASGQRDVDLATAIQKSRMFYATHGLGALASAIPTASDFPPEAHGAIEDAHAVGLDDVFVFPPVALQRTSLDHLVHKLAAASCDRLESDQQYSPPWLYQPEALKTFDVHARPAGAYALCFHSSPFPNATLGKDADELREWLTQRRCASLTAYEYLVLQRLKAEQHADHRFDLNAKSPTSQWHWLLDMSLGHGKDSKIPMAGWNPRLRRIDLGWCGPRDADPAKGVIATRIVPALVAAPSTPAAVEATQTSTNQNNV